MGIQENIIIGQALNMLNKNDDFRKALLSTGEKKEKARNLVRQLAKEIQYLQKTQKDFLEE